MDCSNNFHYENTECVVEREVKNNTNFIAENNGICVDPPFRPPLPFCTNQATSSKANIESQKPTANTGQTRVASSKTRSLVVAGKGHQTQPTHLSTSRRSIAGSHERALSPTSNGAKFFFPNGDPDPIRRSEMCYPVQPPIPREPCFPPERWQTGFYIRDRCGSGILPRRYLFTSNRDRWCKTPLSMYQATIGELGKRILCQKRGLPPRDIKTAPPCNVCEFIFPPCRGYYRKYDCVRPCEEQYVKYVGGRKVFRDRVQRYWDPCDMTDRKKCEDLNKYAHHNAYLGSRLRRHTRKDLPCW